MDIKLKRKEQKHKHVRDHKTLMDRQIEDDYLDSINVKLKMVQELKWKYFKKEKNEIFLRD